MTVPEKWHDFPCADYFESPLCLTGWWDSAGQCWYIEPLERLRVNQARGMLVIGGPVVQGIEGGYRREQPGVWAWRAIDEEFRLVARSVADGGPPRRLRLGAHTSVKVLAGGGARRRRARAPT